MVRYLLGLLVLASSADAQAALDRARQAQKSWVDPICGQRRPGGFDVCVAPPCGHAGHVGWENSPPKVRIVSRKAKPQTLILGNASEPATAANTLFG